MRAFLIAAALAGAVPAAAQPSRNIETTVVVPAPREEVWRAFTTSDAWRRMGVPFVVMDFRVGGVIESSYTPTAAPGDPNNIKNEIVAYVPGRMLAIRNVQAPKTFPYPKEFASTATVFELEPAGERATRITLTAVGYGQGEAYDWLYKAFSEGNAYSLGKLRDSYAAGVTAADESVVGRFEKK